MLESPMVVSPIAELALCESDLRAVFVAAAAERRDRTAGPFTYLSKSIRFYPPLVFAAFATPQALARTTLLPTPESRTVAGAAVIAALCVICWWLFGRWWKQAVALNPPPSTFAWIRSGTREPPLIHGYPVENGRGSLAAVAAFRQAYLLWLPTPVSLFTDRFLVSAAVAAMGCLSLMASGAGAYFDGVLIASAIVVPLIFPLFILNGVWLHTLRMRHRKAYLATLASWR